MQNTATSPEDFESIDLELCFDKGSEAFSVRTITVKINFDEPSTYKEDHIAEDKHFHIEIYDP